MNLPNLITVFRLLLIPVFVILLLENKSTLALITFGIAGISDALDGFLARVLKQKTLFGAYVDPVADKLLLATAFVTLAIMGRLPGWLAVVVVSRDVIIMGGIGILLLNNHPMTIKPTYNSKITTFVQLITICFILGGDYLTSYQFLRNSFIKSTALFTILSGFHYLYIGFQILGSPDRDPTAGNRNHNRQ
jgi:cardiolipin synthase